MTGLWFRHPGYHGGEPAFGRRFYIVVTRLDAWLNGPLDDDAGHLRFGQEECANRLVTDWFVLEVKWRVA